jgi:hypothetical protein
MQVAYIALNTPSCISIPTGKFKIHNLIDTEKSGQEGPVLMTHMVDNIEYDAESGMLYAGVIPQVA